MGLLKRDIFISLLSIVPKANGSNDWSNLCVTIWFNPHRECTLALLIKLMIMSMYIAIVNNSKLVRKNRYLGTQKSKVVKLKRSDQLLFKEDARIPDVKHLNSLEGREV